LKVFLHFDLQKREGISNIGQIWHISGCWVYAIGTSASEASRYDRAENSLGMSVFSKKNTHTAD